MAAPNKKKGRALFHTTHSSKYFHQKILRDRRDFILFVAPAVFAFSLLMLWPLVNLFRLSLVSWNGLLKPKTFIGFQNFVRVFQDRHFRRALQNTLLHFVVSMPGVMFPAFYIGYVLHQRYRGFKLFRTVFFFPAMISVTGLAMMFVGVYLPDGIVNLFLRSVGLSNLARPWLGDPKTVMLAIVLIDLYSGIGYYAVLFLAAFSSISGELTESARLEGASQWTIMSKIYFPMTIDFFGVMTMLHLLYILLDAGQRVLLLTSGGPGDYSLTLGYYLYEQAFKSFRLGYSQAIGVITFGFGVVGMLLIRRITRARH